MRRGRPKQATSRCKLKWLRGRDLNPRPLGYEPNELPDCSTPRQGKIDYIISQRCRTSTSSNPTPFKNDLSVAAAFAEAACRMPPSSAACCTCFSASWRTCDSRFGSTLENRPVSREYTRV